MLQSIIIIGLLILHNNYANSSIAQEHERKDHLASAITARYNLTFSQGRLINAIIHNDTNQAIEYTQQRYIDLHDDGQPFIQLAQERDNGHIVQALYSNLLLRAEKSDKENGQKITLQTSRMIAEKIYSDRKNQLHFAIAHDDIKAIKELISYGVNINQQDKYGESPLLCAISSKIPKMALILIQAGADINQSNVWHTSPLKKAITYDRYDVVQSMINTNQLDSSIASTELACLQENYHEHGASKLKIMNSLQEFLNPGLK